MYTIHQIFESNNLEYWASGGTFLGVIRHKGIIPWDDDCDLCIYDQKKFLSLVPKLNNCGLIIDKIDFGYKIMYKNIPIKEGFQYSFPNVDIFITKLIKSSRPYYCLKYKEARDLWPNEIYYTDQHFPLVKYKFGDNFVYGSNNYKAYLDRMYGKTWNKIAYREYDHEKEEQVDKVIVKLTNKDRVPAKPVPKYTIRKCVRKSSSLKRRSRSRSQRRKSRSRPQRRRSRSR
jgi:lipopolysaccharide cholinephosphotransferase